jgi:hypothetical protein
MKLKIYQKKIQKSDMNFQKILLFIALLYLSSLAFFHNWGDFMLTNGDSHGYYTFLPMAFIHHDYDDLRTSTYYRSKNMVGHADEKYTIKEMPDYWVSGVVVNGKRVIQYNCGVALLQLPFFSLVHTLAPLLGFAADGYSLPYRVGLLLGNFIYVMLGLLLVRRILKRYFDEKTTALTLFLLGMTTNLYYFTVFSGFMAHSYLFFMYAVFMYAVVRFFETFDNKFLLFIGFIGGWIMLIRPPDVVVLLIPFLFKINNFNDIKQRFLLIWSKKVAILGAIIAFFIPFIPQLYYWKRQTGNWIFYLYDTVTFNFKKPDILEGLTSFGNGWLIYTPVMLFALIGLLFKKQRDFRWAVLFFTIIYCYILFSWPIRPFYINGFGCRPMVETYALLAYPLSIFIDWARKRQWVFSIFIVVCLFFTWLNVFQTYQMSENIIVSENVNRAFWLASFGKTQLDYNALVASDSNESQPNEALVLKKVLYDNHFEDSTKANFTRQIGANGVFAYKVEPNTFLDGINVPCSEVSAGAWVKVSLRAFSPRNSKFNIYEKTKIVVQFKRDDKDLKWRATQIENKIGNPNCDIYGGTLNMWGDVVFYVRVPSDVQATDRLGVCLWSTNPNPLIVDDMKIELWK